MASFKRVSFSEENLDLNDIEQFYSDTEASLRLYFSSDSPFFRARFAGLSESEVTVEFELTLEEYERSVSLTVLASLEAAFRIDYLNRAGQKKKDVLSRELRSIYQNKGSRASLEDEIIPAWVKTVNGAGSILSDLKGAFKYRHWLAHGRYWVPKLGRKYDYYSVSVLAQSVFSSLPLQGVDA